MSDDRLAQARAEAERRQTAKHWRMWEDEGEHLGYSWSMGFLAGFREGAEWADANPAPRTITRHDLRAMVDAQADAGMTGGWVSLDDMMTAALATIGIGVDDCASTQEEANP